MNGKKVTFAVNAYDENGLIGTGTHKRAVINKPHLICKKIVFDECIYL